MTENQPPDGASRNASKPRTKKGPRGDLSVEQVQAITKVASPVSLGPPDQPLPWEEDFLKALRTFAAPKQAAATAGVDIEIIFRWRRESARFEELYQRAKEEGVEIVLEQEAMSRALEKSDLLMLAALNAYLPGRYKRDTKQTRFAGNGIVLEITDAE